MKNKIILSGAPSIDLAYFLNTLVEKIPRAVGLVTSPILAGLKVVGLRMHPLPFDGNHEFVIAHQDNTDSNLYVDHYGIYEDALEQVAEYALSLLGKDFSPTDILYLGELGKIQLSSPSFIATVRKYLDLPNSAILTLSDSYNSKFTNEFRRHPHVSVIDIENTTVEVVLKKIRELSG